MKTMAKGYISLPEGGRVAIIGAGPAGSFFALHLIEGGRRKGRSFKVRIFDKKSFQRFGPPGCNMCAGAISSKLVASLGQLGVRLPSNLILHRVDGYTLHMGHRWVDILEDPTLSIFSVFRGGGPTKEFAIENEACGFDQSMLNEAIARGAEFTNCFVSGVEVQGDGGPATVSYDYYRESWQADLVVGAFGVNTTMTERLGFGYKPPKTWHTCQAEVLVGRDFNRRVLRDRIHIFNSENRKFKYLAFTPKGDFVTVSAIGKWIKIHELEEELGSSPAREFLPADWRVSCHCHPSLPVGSARRPRADRLLILGDAYLSRYLKSGIESAFLSASLAAGAVLEHDVSEESLRRYYFDPCRANFVADNAYGRLIFRFYDFVSSHAVLSEANLRQVHAENGQENPEKRSLSTILWNIFTGDTPYKKILLKGLSPALTLKMVGRVLQGLAGRLWGSEEREQPLPGAGSKPPAEVADATPETRHPKA